MGIRGPIDLTVRLMRNSRTELVRPELGPCRVWTGDLSNKNYGQIRFGLHHQREYGKRKMSTHRLAWMLQNGPVPVGMNVLHRCDNRPCFEVEHLFLGTIKDNSEDMVQKGRHSSRLHPERVPRGEQHGNALLTEVKVLGMRETYARGGVSMRMLAAQYAVDLSTVLYTLQGKLWAHVGGPLTKRPSLGERGRGRTKLNKLLAEIIKVNYEAGVFEMKQLAKWFGVHKKTISNIVHGRVQYTS